jgi:hypothetical protein
MDISTRKLICYVIFFDKRLQEKSTIKFAISDMEEIQGIIRTMKNKRLKILEYGVIVEFGPKAG